MVNRTKELGPEKRKLLEELKQIEEENNRKVAKEEQKMRKEGYTHRLTAWIHPPRGDDYSIVTYKKGNFTDMDIANALRKSTVKDDYTVKAL